MFDSTSLRRSQTALAAAALLFSTAALADNSSDNSPSGADWWQWELSIPWSVNPINDATGQNCMVGQNGSTWYLAPAFFGSTVSRSCTVPQGSKLFFPVASTGFTDTPNACGQGAPTSVADMRAFVTGQIDATVASATLNGKPLQLKRQRSEVFPVALPADNLYGPFCGNAPVPAGVYPRNVADGYYGHIERLPVGTHTLRMLASLGPGTDMNVVYTITVVPRDRR